MPGKPLEAAWGVRSGSPAPGFTVAMAAAGLSRPQSFHPCKYVQKKSQAGGGGLTDRTAANGRRNSPGAVSWEWSDRHPRRTVWGGLDPFQGVLGRFRGPCPPWVSPQSLQLLGPRFGDLRSHQPWWNPSLPLIVHINPGAAEGPRQRRKPFADSYQNKLKCGHSSWQIPTGVPSQKV